MSRSHRRLRLTLGGAIVGALGLLLAVALAPAIPAPVPDGARTAAAQELPTFPSLEASCLGLFSAVLGQYQVRDEASALVMTIAQALGIPPGAAFAFLVQLPAADLECVAITAIVLGLLLPAA